MPEFAEYTEIAYEVTKRPMIILLAAYHASTRVACHAKSDALPSGRPGNFWELNFGGFGV